MQPRSMQPIEALVSSLTILLTAVSCAAPPQRDLVPMPKVAAGSVPVAGEYRGQDGAPMALVPAGAFLYRYNNQRLTLPAFYMDVYEVTTRRYGAFLQATGRQEPAYWERAVLVSYGDRPVVGVTWQDADAYCRHYGKRLPTEQEWEKAARGTDGRKYPWGNAAPTSQHAKFDHDGKATWQGYASLATVKSYKSGRSPYGLFHMAGNVWEWTSSDYDRNGQYRVLRGGSWTNGAGNLRSSNRISFVPTLRNLIIGFRCLQEVS